MEKTETKIILPASELSERLNGYNGILSLETIEYLDSLIGLEISALNQGIISDEGMKRLNDLKLYRQIVNYNIYNRVLKAFKKYNNGFELLENNRSLSISDKSSEEKTYDIFNYCIYSTGIPQIGINQINIDPIKRQEQIDKLYQKLKVIKGSEETPECFRKRYLSSSKETIISYISNLISELEKRSTFDGTNIVSQNLFIEQMLGNEGLQVSQDFAEVPAYSNADVAMQSVTLNPYPNQVERDLTKRLVKSYPHTKIIKTIKYY